MALKIMSEVWEHAPDTLSAAHLILLLRLADGAGEHRMVWESVDTFSRRCRQSRRTVFAGLKRLKELRIVEDVPEEEWPREAHLYSTVVRRITPPDEWLTDGAEPLQSTGTEGVQNLHPPNPVVTPDLQLVTQGGAKSAPNPESFTSSLGNPSGYPSRRRRDEDEVPARRGRLRAAATADQELDPARMFGIDPPQKAQPPGQKRKGPARDSAMGMALEFKQQILGSPQKWGPDPANVTALAGSFRKWLEQSITPDEIRAMIELYATVPGYQNPKAPAWRDFLFKRNMLLVSARQSTEFEASKRPEYWDDSPQQFSPEMWD